MSLTTNVNPRGADLLRALRHSLYLEETRMNLTFTPHHTGPLFDLHGWPTSAGRAWLASRPLPAPEPEAPARTCARMAAEIARAVSVNHSVGKRDLERAGFTPAQVETHFEAALTASGVREFE